MTEADLPLVADAAAARLGLSREQIIEYAQRGEVGHVKLKADGAYLFYVSDLAEWCARHHRPAAIEVRSRRAG